MKKYLFFLIIATITTNAYAFGFKWNLFPKPVSTTGGSITYLDSNKSNSRSTTPYIGGYVVHTFLSSGTFTLNRSAVNIEYLLVGGGGGGGGGGGAGCNGSGGGAGQFVTGSKMITPGSYSISIGGGGSGGSGGACTTASTSGGSTSGLSLSANPGAGGTAAKGGNSGIGYIGGAGGNGAQASGGGGGAGNSGNCSARSGGTGGAGGAGNIQTISGFSQQFAGGGVGVAGIVLVQVDPEVMVVEMVGVAGTILEVVRHLTQEAAVAAAVANQVLEMLLVGLAQLEFLLLGTNIINN